MKNSTCVSTEKTFSKFVAAKKTKILEVLSTLSKNICSVTNYSYLKKKNPKNSIWERPQDDMKLQHNEPQKTVRRAQALLKGVDADHFLSEWFAKSPRHDFKSFPSSAFDLERGGGGDSVMWERSTSTQSDIRDFQLNSKMRDCFFLKKI